MHLSQTIGAITLAVALSAPIARGQTVSTLYEFTGGSDGCWPNAGLLDHAGALIGGTIVGGGYGWGALFKLDLQSGAVTKLHDFTGGRDGAFPNTPIVVDGKLYDSASSGGPRQYDGVLFSEDPATGKQKVLHGFRGGKDGSRPSAALTRLGASLYGTTYWGGGKQCSGIGCGTIFRFDPKSGAETVLHRFGGADDGTSPVGAMIEAGGVLYGTTLYGGPNGNGQRFAGAGTVFRFDPASGQETVLHSFTGGKDGAYPNALTYHDGMLYGTANGGDGCAGQVACGIIYSLNPQTGAEQVLYAFTGRPDGSGPDGDLFYHDGALYGTTGSGGTGAGTIFKFDLASKTETVLYAFGGFYTSSTANWLMFSHGKFYGTTLFGGHTGQDDNGCGTVFQFTP